MKFKFIALDSTCSEAEWLKNLLSEILLISSPIPSISIYYDSRAAIDFYKKIFINSKISRHIKMRQKSVRKQETYYDIISLSYVKIDNNLTDYLTKGLSRTKVLESSRGMGFSL